MSRLLRRSLTRRRSAAFQVAWNFTDAALSGVSTAPGLTPGSAALAPGTALTLSRTSAGYASDPVVNIGVTAYASGSAAFASGNTYLELPFTIASGSAQLKALTWNAARTGSNTPRGFAVSVSPHAALVSAANDIGTVRTSWSAFSLDLSGTAPIAGSGSVRFYPYMPDSARSVDLDSVILSGVLGG